MKVLIRTPDPAGGPASERLLDVAVLKIGRGTDQDVVLGDLRVALAHAELMPHKSLLATSLRLESKSRLGVKVNGVPAMQATLKVGDVLDFGAYTLTVGKQSGTSVLVLTLDQRVATAAREAQKAAFKMRLADAGWSRRRLSWLAFAIVVLATLAWPMGHYFLSPPTVAAAERNRLPRQSPAADVLWNSGPMSSAHKALAADCAVCHQQPFVQVRDESCKGCHAALGDHARSIAVAAQAPFAGQRCTDCHREHNGPHGLIPAGNAACTSCHAKPEGLPGHPGLPVADFSRAHPEFALRLPRKAAPGAAEAFVWPTVRQGTPEALKQDTGLEFSHALHLAPAGIDAPEGKRRLDCAGCHQPTADRAGFLPVTMERGCADCHRLDFDPQQPQRLLPHGDVAATTQAVRDHFARVALGGGVLTAGAPAVVRERRRPGETLGAERAQAALAWADRESDRTLHELFEKRSCFTCHTVTRQGESWRVEPVVVPRTAFTQTIFPHDAHMTERCDSCHAMAEAKTADTVHLPTIARCRECHGDTGAMTETASSCQSCHGYHLHASSKP